ncbi:unnamed protein product, partial [Dovyalis caffra]
LWAVVGNTKFGIGYVHKGKGRKAVRCHIEVDGVSPIRENRSLVGKSRASWM